MNKTMDLRYFWIAVIATIFIACFSGYPGGGFSIAKQVATGELVFSADHIGTFTPNVFLSDRLISEGRMPWWNPYVGMGRFLYADVHHYGFLNPIHWFAKAIFAQSMARELGLTVVVYIILIIIASMYWMRLVGIPPLAGITPVLLLLSSWYFSKGAGFALGTHSVYLALLAGITFLEIQFQRRSFGTTLLLAFPMGWLLLTARADVLVYFGIIIVAFTISELLTSEPKYRFRVVAQAFVFIVVSIGITALQTLPTKIIVSESARSIFNESSPVHYSGLGIDLVRGLKICLNNYVFGNRWNSGLMHRVLLWGLALLAIFHTRLQRFNKIRLFAGSGLLILFLVVSGVFDFFLLSIGFNMPIKAYAMIAHIFLFSISGVGAYLLLSGQLTRTRFFAYVSVILTLVLSMCLSAPKAVNPLQLNPHSYVVIMHAMVFMLLIECVFLYRIKARLPAKPVWALWIILWGAGIFLIGNTPLYRISDYLIHSARLFYMYRLVFILLICAWLFIGSILKFSLSIRNPQQSAAVILIFMTILISHVTPQRERLVAPMENLHLPKVASKYFSKDQFRTLNVHARDHKTGMPAAYTHNSVNSLFTYHAYAPYYPYLETSGGYSIAPLGTSNFSDLINLGHLWTDPEHPRNSYEAIWKQSAKEGRWDLYAKSYGHLQALKKSVVIFNADSPFLRYSATRFVISPEPYADSPYIRKIDTLISPTTYGREFRPQIYQHKYFIYEVLNAVPRAYLPQRYVVLNTQDKVIEYLRSSRESEDAAILGPHELTGQTSGQIKRMEWSENNLYFDVIMETEGYLVVSDPYFPGWRVFVDGMPDEIKKANYAFRAVYLKKGEHHVEFRYRPPGIEIGLILSALFVLISLGLGAWLVNKHGSGNSIRLSGKGQRYP